jgi:hypothetical protein
MAALAVPGVTPASVEVTVAPGASAVISKSVETPLVSSSPDIMFLADTTGSMGSQIADVQASIGDIISTIRALQPDARFGAAQYKDVGDCFFGTIPDPGSCVPGTSPGYNLDGAISANDTATSAAVGTWNASGGGDTPEAQVTALYHLGTDSGVGWRAGSSHIIVQFGDATGHDPSDGHTLADAIAALGGIDARWLGIDVLDLDGVPNETSDTVGQATMLANATGGLVIPEGTDIADAILDGLQSLDATVAPTLSTCDPDLDVSWDAPSKTVDAGDTATFQETIAVDPSATPGSTLECEVTFLVNGGADPAFVESTTVHVEGEGEAHDTLDLTVLWGPAAHRQLAYANAGALSLGDYDVNPSSGTPTTISGSGTIPSTVSGDATVSFNLSFDGATMKWSGTVVIDDPAAGFSATVPVHSWKHGVVRSGSVTSGTLWGFKALSVPQKCFEIHFEIDDLA